MTESTKVNFSNGGICVVMVGNTGFVQEYATHPNVIFVRTKEIDPKDLSLSLNMGNIKAFIITEGIPQWHYTWAMSFVKTNKIVYLVRKSNQAVYQQLKEFFPIKGNGTTSAEAKDAFVRGKLTFLTEHIDFTKSNMENAKKLLRLATEKGVKSTEGSLAQFVSIQRRKQSGTGIPRSARPKLDLSVELLDNMIKDLGDMRDFIIATTEENRMLKTKLERFKKAMED